MLESVVAFIHLQICASLKVRAIQILFDETVAHSLLTPHFSGDDVTFFLATPILYLITQQGILENLLPAKKAQ